MGRILTKPYKRWEPGTVLTSDQDEFSKAALSMSQAMLSASPLSGMDQRTVYVNAERLAQLEREGYFDAPAKEAP